MNWWKSPPRSSACASASSIRTSASATPAPPLLLNKRTELPGSSRGKGLAEQSAGLFLLLRAWEQFVFILQEGLAPPATSLSIQRDVHGKTGCAPVNQGRAQAGAISMQVI